MTPQERDQALAVAALEAASRVFEGQGLGTSGSSITRMAGIFLDWLRDNS